MGTSPVPRGCSEPLALPPGSAKQHCTPRTGGGCSQRCKFEEWGDVLVDSCARSVSHVRTEQLRWRNLTFSKKKRKRRYLNTKYSFICHRRLHTVTSVWSLFFFFLEGIYICTYLQPGCIYTVKNTVLETQSVEKKKFLKKLVPDFRKIITQGNDKSLQCWACRCSFDTKSSSGLELH